MMTRLSSALEQEYAPAEHDQARDLVSVRDAAGEFSAAADCGPRRHTTNSRLYFQEAVLPLLLVRRRSARGVYVVGRLLSQFKTAYDWLIARLPGIGGAIRMVALARFARALASLYAAGVAIPEALRYAAAATGNAFMAKRMMTAIPALQGGHGIAEALMATNIFPPMVDLHAGNRGADRRIGCDHGQGGRVL